MKKGYNFMHKKTSRNHLKMSAKLSGALFVNERERKTAEKLSASGAQNFLLGVLKLWIHEGYSTYTFSLVYVCRSKILFFQFE